MNKYNKIGIFDSGIGGVTVLSKILKLLPYEQYIYYSDSINNPYGSKNKDELINITCNIVDYFISKECKAIVIACNTASMICTDILKEKYKDIIFVPIEPAYKMVHDNNFQSNTLIMATPGTINSNKFLNLYHKYDNGKTILLPCNNLANLIETNSENLDKYLENLLLPYNNKINSVVLGCTHYPLIKNKIKKYLGNIIFYDGAYEVATNLKKQLIDNNLINDRNKKEDIIFIDSSKKIEKTIRFFELLDKYD